MYNSCEDRDDKVNWTVNVCHEGVVPATPRTNGNWRENFFSETVRDRALQTNRTSTMYIHRDLV